MRIVQNRTRAGRRMLDLLPMTERILLKRFVAFDRRECVGYEDDHLAFAMWAKALLTGVFVLHFEDMPFGAFDTNSHDLPASPIRNDPTRRRRKLDWYVDTACHDVATWRIRFRHLSGYRASYLSLCIRAFGNGLLPNDVKRKEKCVSGDPLPGPMNRSLIHITIDPERAADYDHIHAHPWPDMMAAIEASGYRNYSGFRRGASVVYYGEYYPDIETVSARMAEHEVTSRWGEAFEGLITTIVGPDGKLITADEVFHQD